MAEKKSNTAETSRKSLKNTGEKTAPKKANSTSHKTASANRKSHIKKALIQALKESMGLITTACSKAGISRTTFYDYYNNDPEFKAEVEAINEYAIDEGESLLRSRMREKDTTAIIFYLKTKGKGRGYIEKQEIQLTESDSVELLKKIGRGEL